MISQKSFLPNFYFVLFIAWFGKKNCSNIIDGVGLLGYIDDLLRSSLHEDAEKVFETF